MKYFEALSICVVRDVANLMGHTLVKVERDKNAATETLASDEGGIKTFVDNEKLRVVFADEHGETHVLDFDIRPRRGEKQPRVKSVTEYLTPD